MQSDQSAAPDTDAGAESSVAGDTFATAYPEMYRAAYRVAYRLLGRADEADDIAQEACARAFARWSRVRHMACPPAWATRVAANIALDMWRRRQTAARTHLDLTVAEEFDPGQRVDLHRALATLPRRQRDVVVLRYLADLTESDVAATLRCSLGTVKTHASRGLATLRAEMKEL